MEFDGVKIATITNVVQASCPKHHGYMKIIEEGWGTTAVFYCEQCKYPYQLKLMKLTRYNSEALKTKLKRLEKPE